jgi:hypothetical protein
MKMLYGYINKQGWFEFFGEGTYILKFKLFECNKKDWFPAREMMKDKLLRELQLRSIPFKEIR